MINTKVVINLRQNDLVTTEVLIEVHGYKLYLTSV